MKVLAIYDSGPSVADRYTVIYNEKYSDELYQAVGMGETPFHPQGFCQYASSCYPLPKKNFKKIRFENLPEDCQKVIARDVLNLND
jgi:hypothetical protein